MRRAAAVLLLVLAAAAPASAAPSRYGLAQQCVDAGAGAGAVRPTGA